MDGEVEDLTGVTGGKHPASPSRLLGRLLRSVVVRSVLRRTVHGGRSRGVAAGIASSRDHGPARATSRPRRVDSSTPAAADDPSALRFLLAASRSSSSSCASVLAVRADDARLQAPAAEGAGRAGCARPRVRGALRGESLLARGRRPLRPPPYAHRGTTRERRRPPRKARLLRHWLLTVPGRGARTFAVWVDADGRTGPFASCDASAVRRRRATRAGRRGRGRALGARRSTLTRSSAPRPRALPAIVWRDASTRPGRRGGSRPARQARP